MELETLLEILEKSVAKHGKDKPLTLGHLQNLLLMVMRKVHDDSHIEALNEDEEANRDWLYKD